MNWHYLENGQQMGPVGEEQFAELYRSGRINASTLVWREGLADWLPFSQVGPEAQPPAGGPRLSLASRETAGTSGGICAECGNNFPKDEMIQYGGRWICASCKPVFLQKLTEGAPLAAGDLRYAGFFIRFAAVFLDGIIMGIFNFVLGLIAGVGLGPAFGQHGSQGFSTAMIVVFIIEYFIAFAYEPFFIGRFGATPGKMACGIKVVTGDGGRVSYWRALGRAFAKLLSFLPCFIGYIMVFFDDQKRALHDRICNTRVVYK